MISHPPIPREIVVPHTLSPSNVSSRWSTNCNDMFNFTHPLPLSAGHRWDTCSASKDSCPRTPRRHTGKMELTRMPPHTSNYWWRHCLIGIVCCFYWWQMLVSQLQKSARRVIIIRSISLFQRMSISLLLWIGPKKYSLWSKNNDLWIAYSNDHQIPLQLRCTVTLKPQVKGRMKSRFYYILRQPSAANRSKHCKCLLETSKCHSHIATGRQ